jgi:hypothetical protein
VTTTPSERKLESYFSKPCSEGAAMLLDDFRHTARGSGKPFGPLRPRISLQS